jgi:tetratricopeptide (TPR) repeat protein
MQKFLTYLFLTGLFIFHSGNLLSQSKYRGSFGENSEREICIEKLDSANLVFDETPEKALTLVEEGLLLAIKNNFREEEAKAYQILGGFNFELAEYALSLKNYKKAIRIYSEKGTERKMSKKISRFSESSEKSGTPDFLYEIYPKAGKAAQFAGDLDESLSYYLAYLTLAEKANIHDDIVLAKTSLGDIYTLKDDYEKANSYYSNVLEMEIEQGNKKGEITINNKLGKLKDKQNDEENALQHFERSRDVALDMEDDAAVNESFGNIAAVHKENNDIVQELEVSQQAMQYNAMKGNTTEMARNQVEIGEILIKQDKNEEAIQHLESGLELSEETGDIETKSQAVKALSEAYDKKGDKSESLEKYKEYVELEDSINEMRKADLIASNKTGRLLESTENKMLVLEKDKELDEKTIELLRREQKLQAEQIKRQKMINYFLFGSLLLLLTASFFVYRSNQSKRKANSLLMLKSLRSQMNPHFIFNALNSVNNYISVNDERAANKYLADFSKLMRDVLENSSEDFIPLSKEIEILKMYIKLEHHRFKDKFNYEFKVDENLKPEAYLIPPMLIQPYIENAVWHGLRYKEGKGKLNVNFEQKSDFVEISISDDGIGRKKSKEIKTENQKIMKSTGLKNIEDRLQIIKEVYSVQLDVTIADLDNRSNKGTKVVIKLPRNTFVND